MRYPEDAPTLSELNREEWEDTYARLPKWFKAPLTHTRAHRDKAGGPSESVACTEHPAFHAHGTRSSVLYWAERHVRTKHAGQALPDLEPDPWTVGTEPSPDTPF